MNPIGEPFTWHGIDVEKRRRRHRFASIVSRPFRTIPVVGNVVSVFWYVVVDEGPRALPDALSFSFLGDSLFAGRWVTEPTTWLERTLRRAFR